MKYKDESLINYKIIDFKNNTFTLNIPEKYIPIMFESLWNGESYYKKLCDRINELIIRRVTHDKIETLAHNFLDSIYNVHNKRIDALEEEIETQ